MGAGVGTGVALGMSVGLGVGNAVGLGRGVAVGEGAGVGSGIAVATRVGSGTGVVVSYFRESSDVPLADVSDCGLGVALGSSIASSGMAVGSIAPAGTAVAVGSAIIIGVDRGAISGSASIMAWGVGLSGIAASGSSSIRAVGSIIAAGAGVAVDIGSASEAALPPSPPPSNSPVTLPATITVKATTARAVETRIVHSNTDLSGGGVGAVTAAGASLKERGASTSGIRRSIWTVALSDSISSVHESQPCKCASSAIRSASGSSPSK